MECTTLRAFVRAFTLDGDVKVFELADQVRSHLSPSPQVRKISTIFCFVLTCTFSRSGCNNKQQVQCIFTCADILEPGCSCDKLRRSRRPSLSNDTSTGRLELMLLQYC